MNTYYRKTESPIRTNRNNSYEINPIRALAHSSGFGLMALAVGQSLLALAMHASTMIATAHALLTIAVGLSFALFSKDKRKVGYVAAYITGVEVLWRMTDAQIFWEAGKYATVLVLGIALLRMKHWQRIGWPLLYFGLLSLSIPLTIFNFGYSSAARDAISFNLSGPLALIICILYFSQVTLDQGAIRRLAWWVIIPIFGIATLVMSGMFSAGTLFFADKSNFATSGGFGPNQVSAALGLGGGLALILFFIGKGMARRLIILILALGFLILCALTFSRGGLYNAAVMLVLVMVHYLRSARGRIVVMTSIFVIGLVGGYLIFPRLNAYTGGMLEQRFTNFDTDSRGQIAQADLNLWFANPAFGVGPGLAKTDRMEILGYIVASHTEYTRMLAEHGTAGFLALLVLLFIAIRAYLQAPNIEAQIWVVALLAWPLVEMTHSAMRIVAISFLLGLAMVNWDVRESASQAPRNQAVMR